MAAGRPKGAPNKQRRLLLVRLEELYGKEFNPVMKIAENAVVLQGIASQAVKDNEGVAIAVNDAINAWDKVAVYVQPKLKAVEHSSNELNIQMNHMMGFDKPDA